MAKSNAERQRRDRRSRPQQWRDALNTIIALRDAWQAWRDAMPETLEASPTAERLDEVLECLEEVDWEHLAALDLPRGFGRDT